MATRNCARCGTPFHLRPQGLHAKFCSTTCRVAANKQRNLEQTTLDFQIGGLVFTLTNVPRDIDHDILRRDILERCGDDLRAAIEKLHPIQQGEQR